MRSHLGEVLKRQLGQNRQKRKALSKCVGPLKNPSEQPRAARSRSDAQSSIGRLCDCVPLRVLSSLIYTRVLSVSAKCAGILSQTTDAYETQTSGTMPTHRYSTCNSACSSLSSRSMRCTSSPRSARIASMFVLSPNHPRLSAIKCCLSQQSHRTTTMPEKNSIHAPDSQHMRVWAA